MCWIAAILTDNNNQEDESPDTPHNPLPQHFSQSQHAAATPYQHLTGRDTSPQPTTNHTTAKLASM
ncbi:hypothetical protein, partial [Xylella fastidiosa]|uniref:hypothetical protein n=1 Tax=Xylella fastidiosa TaxID=2371 RepID=UPI001EEBF9A5